MVFWADELVKKAKELSDKMEVWSANAPRDEEGNVLAGTPEVRQFNRCVFALSEAIMVLRGAEGEISDPEKEL